MDSKNMKISIVGQGRRRVSATEILDEQIQKVKELIEKKVIQINRQLETVFIWVDDENDPNARLGTFIQFVDPSVKDYKFYAVKKPEPLEPNTTYQCDHLYSTPIPPYFSLHDFPRFDPYAIIKVPFSDKNLKIKGSDPI